KAGFEYARTVANLHATHGDDPFEMPTTVQLYPHRKSVYVKGFLRGPLVGRRARLFWTALASDDLVQRVERLIELCRSNGGVLRPWGHSWELEAFDLWSALETILRRLAAEADSITFATNYGVHEKAQLRLSPR